MFLEPKRLLFYCFRADLFARRSSDKTMPHSPHSQFPCAINRSIPNCVWQQQSETVFKGLGVVF